jgi:hypothetical protein
MRLSCSARASTAAASGLTKGARAAALARPAQALRGAVRTDAARIERGRWHDRCSVGGMDASKPGSPVHLPIGTRAVAVLGVSGALLGALLTLVRPWYLSWGTTREELAATLPGFTAPANYFGIFIPKGVPDDVIKTVEKAWAETISKSEAIKKYANSRGALFAPSSGEAAQKAVFPAIQANAWLLFNGGKAKVSPDTVGIPKP